MHDKTEHLGDLKHDDWKNFDLKRKILNESNFENVGLNEHGRIKPQEKNIDRDRIKWAWPNQTLAR